MLRYVINVTHCNLCYGASRLFITPNILPVYDIPLNLLVRRSLPNLVISLFGAEKKEEDVPFSDQ